MGNLCFPIKEQLLLAEQIQPPLPEPPAASSPHRKCKDFCIMVMGSADVGKSTLMKRLAQDTLREASSPTSEDTFGRWRGCRHGKGILHINDNTHSCSYRACVARARAFLVVYSITRKTSLEETKPDLELIRKIKGNDLPQFPILLVGNRIDEKPREVSPQEGAAFAREWNCAFMEISTKEDINLKELLHILLSTKKEPEDCVEKPASSLQKKFTACLQKSTACLQKKYTACLQKSTACLQKKYTACLQKKSKVSKIVEKLLGKFVNM
ncbi:GTP-binding protein Di-Ras3 [Dipodomys merriami]|uniref:GTP-binding protein Di-Ras3 n=1 Tax=Dipodomys spectabilis TaxID=105255 RepID=UPI001C54A7C2|nr:GTP-binding protein Di-Ras3 [Dipodomys spectabilis]